MKTINLDSLYAAAKEGTYGPWSNLNQRGFDGGEEFFASIVARLRSHIKLFNDEKAEYPWAGMNLNYGPLIISDRKELLARIKELAELCGIGLSLLEEKEDDMVIRTIITPTRGRTDNDN